MQPTAESNATDMQAGILKSRLFGFYRAEEKFVQLGLVYY